jgi:hypothetical protein
MKTANLNDNEKKVIAALYKEAELNGFDFVHLPSLTYFNVEGLTTNQIKGYLSDLIKKGLITGEELNSKDGASGFMYYANNWEELNKQV